MQLRSTVVRCALLAAAVASAGPVRANPFAYVFQPLAPGVWAALRQDPFELPQEGNALFVVTDRGVVLFDAGGSPAMGEAIVAKVKAVTTQPITHVVLSHWHGDHMRGLQAIRAAFPQALILAHPHARDFIADTQERWLKRRVSMAPNITKAVRAALEKSEDLSGRPLIPAEKKWLEAGLAIVDTLDRENQRTAFVVPDATFEDRLTLFLGGREIRFLRVGNAHTAGDLILWLPAEKIVATGDIVTAPIPLMPSPWTHDYPATLEAIKALDFATLVPGHGAIEHDAQYLDLMSETIRSVGIQMKALVAQGVGETEAVSKIDFAGLEPRFTHGDPFLAHRFEDYVAGPLPQAAFAVESGKGPAEVF